MSEDVLEIIDDEYWSDVDDDWRSLVCTDDMLTEAEYREYLDAWWAYEEEEDGRSE